MTILLADDHGLFRDSMALWIKQYDKKINIEFAYDWTSLNQQLSRSFDLLMLDLNMPGMQGATSISDLLAFSADLKILVVSANDEPQTMQTCLDCGASGYITKASDGHEILKAISTVLSGNIHLPQALTNRSITAPIKNLSNKQLKLLTHLAKGDSNKTIADKMHLSEGTVKQYVSRLLVHLDVDNRTQAGIKARDILGI